MVDLSSPQSGSIGPGCWFSDLFVAALKGPFTGGLLVRTDGGDRGLFFRNGDPVHANGSGFSGNYLGQIVVELGLSQSTAVMEALHHQQAIPELERPLLGEVLIAKLGLTKDDVEIAVRAQCQRRFADSFGISGGTFQSAPGDNQHIRAVAVPTEGWPILLDGLTEHGCDAELLETANRLLGRSVKMKGTFRQLEALMNLPPKAKDGLRYLDKPRKPDQLERILRRRPARGLLRVLEILDLLEIHPASKAIPIPKALKKTPSVSSKDTPVRSPEPIPPTPKPRPPEPSGPGVAPERAELVREVERFHQEINDLDYFELLGVKPNEPAETVRKRYTDLAKRFHPDTFSSEAFPPEVAEKGREISARINEAYRVLSNPETRTEYVLQLADGRILGDSRRKDLVQDAEFKCTKALVLLKQRQYKAARELLRSAVDNDPRTPVYKAHYAWSMIADPDFDRKDAIRQGLPALEEAVRAEPRHAMIHFYLGRVHKQQGHLEKALEAFTMARKLDPAFADAEREVRLLTRRLDKDRGGQWLDWFFKR